MRKSIACILAAFVAAVSCLASEPEYTPQSGEVLDALWADYFNGEDDSALDKILAYVNTEDKLSAEINKDFERLSADRQFMDILNGFGAVPKDGRIDVPFDLEMLVGFLFRDTTTAEDARYIYSFFPQDMIVRAAVKMTAFWSVIVYSQKYQPVFFELQKRMPLLRQTVQYHFNSYLDIHGTVPLLSSENGYATYEDGGMRMGIYLIDDMQAQLDEWYSLAVEEAPRVVPVTEVTAGQIAPFIVYTASTATQFPLYYDLELIRDHDSLEAVPGMTVKKLSIAEDAPKNLSLLYTADTPVKKMFTAGDRRGRYAFRITVYSPWLVYAVYELWFTY